MNHATPPPLTEIPGENRTYSESPDGALYVDMVPSSCWFTNVRYCIASKDWDRLRRFIYARAQHRCEICHARRRIECHERWTYDARTLTQKLIRLIALCHSCHEATHFGLASMRGRATAAGEHLMRVNGWTYEMTREHIEGASELYHRRSTYTWHLDLSILTDAGIEIRRPVRRNERNRIADESLD